MNEKELENPKSHSTKESVIFFKTQDDFRKWLESH